MFPASTQVYYIFASRSESIKMTNVVDDEVLIQSQYRDLKTDVYSKRLTSDTLFAIKTKSLIVKYFT